MELSDEQKQTIRQWVGEGCGLSELQRKIADELGVSMTYMDVRFLVMDLGVSVKDKPAPVAPSPAAAPAAAAGGGLVDAGGGSVSAPSGVTVDVDRVTKPGSVVSGSVTFSDGTNAKWMLDQQGRLALDAGDPSYRPSDGDVQAFQDELRGALESRGF